MKLLRSTRRPPGTASLPTAALLAAAVLLAHPSWAGAGGRAAAQEREDTVQVSPQPAPTQEGVELPEIDEPATPGGAFLRAVLLPGWGHASIGAYTRGGFYFSTETAALWMLLRTHRRLSAAKDARDFREAVVEARLREEGIEDPAEIEEALADDEDVEDARSLVSARDQQFEDWLALGIFLTFLAGADAFVSAHLMDFPDPVTIGVRPVGASAFEVGVSVTLPPIR